jgi:signal transduction histidine kinase
MSTQLLARLSLENGTRAHRLMRRLEAIYPLTFVTDPASRVEWASRAWCARAAEERGEQDARSSVSEFCRLHGLSRVIASLPEKGGLLRARVELPGSRGPADLSLFSLATDDSQQPCHVAIARPGECPRRNGERPALLDDAPQALLAVDEQGFVAYANPAAEELLELEPGALEGCALAALAIDAEGLETLLNAFEGPTQGELAVTLRGRRGGTVPVLARAAPGRSSEGPGLRLVVALGEDARGSETELARRNEELEHCVNTLAHDLRSPLVALLGFSRLLRQDFGERLDETGAHFIDRIEQAGRTMENLIHDLLELSRIGRTGERARLVDPRAVLLQLGAEFKPRLDAAGVRLVLPEAPPLLFCDRTRLYQVFSNLIGNALDHMGECENRRIEVSILETPRVHQITVRDFGQGIAPEHREKIFDVFQTVGTRRRDSRRGTGMGLAIVRKIAETHRGRAWVESAPGEGAAFHVTFPRR